MGEKLNENNPGIADLSDPNRSTKVAEKYNSLYDNEWTDVRINNKIMHTCTSIFLKKWKL
jgi:hypothetical protein